jgi:hypothetical protein
MRRRSVREQSVDRPGKFLEMPLQRGCEKWQRGGVGPQQIFELPRVGRAEGQPRASGERVLRWAYALSCFEERCELVWRELAQSFEVWSPGKRPDTYQAHGSRARECPSDATQHVNEIQLIEEIVFVPQNELVVGPIVLDRRPAGIHVGERVFIRTLDAPIREGGQVAGADLQKLFVGEPAGDRTLMQHVGPHV